MQGKNGEYANGEKSIIRHSLIRSFATFCLVPKLRLGTQMPQNAVSIQTEFAEQFGSQTEFGNQQSARRYPTPAYCSSCQFSTSQVSESQVLRL